MDLKRVGDVTKIPAPDHPISGVSSLKAPFGLISSWKVFLRGQHHMAIDTAPALFAEAVHRFVIEADRAGMRS